MKLKINERGATALWITHEKNEKEAFLLLSIYTFHSMLCVRVKVNASYCSDFTTCWKTFFVNGKYTTFEQFLKNYDWFCHVRCWRQRRKQREVCWTNDLMESVCIQKQFFLSLLLELTITMFMTEQRCRWHYTVILFNWKEQREVEMHIAVLKSMSKSINHHNGLNL